MNSEFKKHIKTINNLTYWEMGHLYRFAPSGHLYFESNSQLNKYFMDKFKQLGGMTPSLSKSIGWEK